MHASNLQQRLDSLAWMATALQAQPNANALYMGYESGDFFMLRRWRDDPNCRPCSVRQPRQPGWCKASR